MTKKLHCPSCTMLVAEPSEGCVLHDLIQVARDRGETPEKKLRKLHANCDTDALWTHVGEIIDKLEDGYYSE